MSSPPRAEPARHPVRVTCLTVLRRETVTPRMVRVVLGGDDLARFESHVPDEHVKIVFSDDDGQVRPPVELDDDRLEWPRPFPANREYTVRRVDRSAGELWLDFVVHDGGLASDWAQEVAVGRSVWLAGPRPGLVVPPAFTRIALLGDHTALPAIARWLEELPTTSDALVAVQVPDAAERQPLATRDGVDITWLHEDDQAAGTLVDVLDAGGVTADGNTYLWAAGEAGLLKPIRQWARAHGFARGTCDIAGYWRRSRTA